MITEKIQRSEETRTKASNVIIVLTAEEGKKIITQDWVDYKNGDITEMPDPGVCSKVYLADQDSALNYTEVDEATANSYEEEYNAAMDKLREEEEKEREEELKKERESQKTIFAGKTTSEEQ